VKQRLYPMLGFKSFRNSAVTIRGIELAQEIKKGQFNISKLTDSREAHVTQVWEAVLAV
jgi:transposase-like protein